MQLPVGGDGLVDEAEKLEPLLVPMAHLAQAKDLAVGRIQRGQQCDRAVAFVVALTTIPLAGSQRRFFFVYAAAWWDWPGVRAWQCRESITGLRVIA